MLKSLIVKDGAEVKGNIGIVANSLVLKQFEVSALHPESDLWLRASVTSTEVAHQVKIIELRLAQRGSEQWGLAHPLEVTQQIGARASGGHYVLRLHLFWRFARPHQVYEKGVLEQDLVLPFVY